VVNLAVWAEVRLEAVGFLQPAVELQVVELLVVELLVMKL
jgi:hypothetical protein